MKNFLVVNSLLLTTVIFFTFVKSCAKILYIEGVIMDAPGKINHELFVKRSSKTAGTIFDFILECKRKFESYSGASLIHSECPPLNVLTIKKAVVYSIYTRDPARNHGDGVTGQDLSGMGRNAPFVVLGNKNDMPQNGITDANCCLFNCTKFETA